MKCWLGLAAGSAAWLFAALVSAAPSIWQRAAHPELAEEQAGLVRLERGLAKAEEASTEPALVPEISLGAVSLLRLSTLDLDRVRDPRLCLLVGKALVDAESAPEAEARATLAPLLTRIPESTSLEAKRLLERGLEALPGSPLSVEAELDLGQIAGKIGDLAAERAAYLRAVALDWDPERRAFAYLKLAASDMRAGDLRLSIREYRQASLNAGERQDVLALAYYGLAVALERSGDLPRALAQAEQANRIKLPPGVYPAQSALDLPGAWFVPAYERHYVKALAAMASAQSARDAEARRDHLADAIEHFEAYLVVGGLDDAPWLQNARLREARARHDLAALDAQSSSAR